MTEIDMSFSKKSYMVRAIHNDTDHCYIHEVISKIQKVQALVKLNKFQEIKIFAIRGWRPCRSDRIEE